MKEKSRGRKRQTVSKNTDTDDDRNSQLAQARQPTTDGAHKTTHKDKRGRATDKQTYGSGNNGCCACGHSKGGSCQEVELHSVMMNDMGSTMLMCFDAVKNYEFTSRANNQQHFVRRIRHKMCTRRNTENTSCTFLICSLDLTEFAR